MSSASYGKTKRSVQKNSTDVFAARRRAAIRQATTKTNLDAFLATNPQDVSYLSGFTGEDSFLLFSRSWALLITDGRFAEQAQKECNSIEILSRTGPIPQALANGLAGRNVRRLGLQEEHVTLDLQNALTKVVGSRKLVAIASVTKKLRAIKDPGEIKIIRKAIRIAQDAFRELIAPGASYLIGRTESQLASELEYLMRQAGADGSAFGTIVAAAANSSKPHHIPGRTKVKPNQALLFDWGANVAGYCSDLTRVVFVGKISPKIREIYDVVRQAQRAGIRTARPSVLCSTVDAAARKVIADAGYAEQFVHSLGHGIGRDVHEAPALAVRSRQPLRAGMVVTVEPGIYLPGLGGVRIEDDVLITPTGSRKLSSLSSSLDDMILT